MDPLWEAFCARHGYRFIPGRELWPNRAAVAHGKIDHRLALTMDVTFAEVLDRGFYPHLPWSLYATASLPFYTQPPDRGSQVPVIPPDLHRPVLTFDLFRRLPFSQMADALEEQLERGFSILSEVSREDILRKGEVPPGKHGPPRPNP